MPLKFGHLAIFLFCNILYNFEKCWRFWRNFGHFGINFGINGEKGCMKINGQNFPYFNFLYSLSSTGSSHSFEVLTPGTSIARCENQLSFAAPCQCLTFAGMFTQSPGFNSMAFLPNS